MKSRLLQGYHIIRQRRWGQLGALLSPRTLMPKVQAEIWREIAEHYAQTGNIAEADAAYTRGLSDYPKAFHLRVARRRLVGRPISLLREHRLVVAQSLRDRLSLTEEPAYVSSEQVIGGTSGNTDLIARHRFSDRTTGRSLSLIEKRLYSPPGASRPREAKLATTMSGDVGGEYFRFPVVYAVLDCLSQQATSVYMEDLGTFPKVARDDHALALRASALGEFARYFSDRTADISPLNGSPIQVGRLIKVEDLRVFEGLVPAAAVARASQLLRHVLETGIGSAGFPEIVMPSKGDANGSNLPIHEDGKVVFIDNGSVGMAPVGRDMASMLGHYFQRLFFRSSIVRRLSEMSSDQYVGERHLNYASLAEGIAFSSYLKGGDLARFGITEATVRHGYAKYLLHSLYQKHVRPIILKRDGLRASEVTTALDDIGATVERAAMKKIVQIIFALERIRAQIPSTTDSIVRQ